jgi:adenosine deaminase
MDSLDVPNKSFASALAEGLASRLVEYPKADLHSHSIFSASIKSIEEWAGISVVRPPLRMKNLEEMQEYSHKELYPVINNKAGFEFTAERTIMEAARDGVTLLEMSLDVNFSTWYPGSLNGFLDFVGKLARKYAASIEFRPEIGVSKNRPPRSQIPLALECVDSGLFRSIDLYGGESAQPPEDYAALYEHAARRGLKTKAHVGEFGDAALVERTLSVLGLREIQHGVAAATSLTLMNLLRKERIRLNVCPASNVALSVARDLKSHPIRVLVDNGLRVSINTDDKTIFGNALTDEYVALHKAGVLSATELDEIRKDALRPPASASRT